MLSLGRIMISHLVVLISSCIHFQVWFYFIWPRPFLHLRCFLHKITHTHEHVHNLAQCGCLNGFKEKSVEYYSTQRYVPFIEWTQRNFHYDKQLFCIVFPRAHCQIILLVKVLDDILDSKGFKYSWRGRNSDLMSSFGWNGISNESGLCQCCCT